MKKRLRVAQIGMEHDHASPTMRSVRKLTDDFELVGYAPVSRDIAHPAGDERAAEGVPRYTPEQLLNLGDLDAVIVETHDTQLSQYAQMAADAGFPIHVDKPCGTDYASIRRLFDTLKQKKLAFQSGYMYRFNPAVREALRMKENGELGEIFSVEAHMDCEHKPEKRAWLSGVPGGMMMFLGCHLTDLILQFCGIPKEILPMSCSTRQEGVDSLDYGFAVYKYDNGVSFAKTCAREIGGFHRRQLVITGSRATVEIRPLERYLHRVPDMTCDMTVTTADCTKGAWDFFSNDRLSFPPYDRYDGMMHDFACIVRGEYENPYTLDYELELYKAVILSCGLAL